MLKLMHFLTISALLFTFMRVSMCADEVALPALAGWGKPCKTGLDGSIIKPEDECEQGVGLVCQHYEQGEYCGCPINGILSFDHASEQCRRKVGSICTPFSPIEEKKVLFNRKCHQNAECVQPNSTSSTERPSREAPFICLCKEGYYSPNFNECLDVNAGKSLVSFSFSFQHGLFPLLIIAVLFNTIVV